MSSPRPEVRVLNVGRSTPTGNTNYDAVNGSQRLQKLMLQMRAEFMDKDGTGVDYKLLKSSDLFTTYKQYCQELVGVNLDILDETKKMVFFINIYNVLTIHGLLECETLPNSVLDVQQFWHTTAYNIGGLIFSLDDIEHGILRGNRPHPAANDAHFSAKDPRLKYSVKQVDPRIHFALVCGAKSCPPINVYTEKNLQRALDLAAKNFIEQETTVNMKFKEIELSRIFQWYRTDFGADEIQAVRWTLKYLCEDKVYGIENLIDLLVLEGGVRISYKDYNWQLNETMSEPSASEVDVKSHRHHHHHRSEHGKKSPCKM